MSIMHIKILITLLIFQFLSNHVTGLHVGEELDRIEKEQGQSPYLNDEGHDLQQKVDDKVSDANHYLRRLESLEAKLSHFFLQDKGFERIGTMAIVNNGHVQVTEIKDPETAVPNKTNVNIKNKSEGLELTKKYFEDTLQHMEHRLHHLARPVMNSNLVLETSVPKDCSDVASKKSGVFVIKPLNSEKSFAVYCDMETEGGGWTVFQNRFDGKVDFYKGWHDYKYGFGKINGEYWLGLEKLNELTSSQANELYIKLEDFENNKTYAHYNLFGIGTENEGYRLSFLGPYNGTAGDSLKEHVGFKFSTHDKDQDTDASNCAVSYTGAWWYYVCHQSNLNGGYLKGQTEVFAKGMVWLAFRGYHYSLKTSRMMIRPNRNI